jgi:branched-chain amino acid transport system permease protein
MTTARQLTHAIMRRNNRLQTTADKWQLTIVVSIVAIALVLGSLNQFLQSAVTLLVIWVLMAQGWNIISGYAGPLALGQAAFFGLADYVTLLLLQDYGVSQYIGALAGIAASVMLALVIGGITLRRPAFFFAVASILIPQILLAVTQYFGVYQILRPYYQESRPDLFWFSNPSVYMYIGGVLVAMAAAGTAIMSRHRFGRFLVATRENERAAESAGVPTYRYKLYAYLIAAVLAALAGILYSQISTVFDPVDVYDPSVSTMAFLLPMLGGAGTIAGPVIGGAIIIPVQQALNTYVNVPGLSDVLFAVVIIVLAMRAPGGVYQYAASALRRLGDRLKRREQTEDSSAGARIVSIGSGDGGG